MNEASLIAAVVGLVAVMRSAQPKIDGLLVVATTIAAAVVVVLAYDPAGSAAELGRHAVRIALAATGTVFAIGRVGEKVGYGLGRATIAPPAGDAPPPDIPKPPLLPRE